MSREAIRRTVANYPEAKLDRAYGVPLDSLTREELMAVVSELTNLREGLRRAEHLRSGPALIQLGNGDWVDPQFVRAVRCIAKPTFYGVQVSFDDGVTCTLIDVDCPDWASAVAERDRIAGLVLEARERRPL